MSGASERMSERSEWPSTLRVDFIVILPTVKRLVDESCIRCRDGFHMVLISRVTRMVASD